MDSREGGHWLYAITGPKGEKHWNMVHYISIEKEKYFKAKDGFSDKNGIINPDLPQNLWENQYIAKNGRTLVIITLSFDTLEDLETIIKMGFKEGFTMGLNQLDEVLTTLQNK